MEIFKKCNNLAGKIFQSKSKSHYVNCFDADSGQKPFIIWLQFRQVKWFLRKVRLVVFSLPQSPTATAPSQRGPRRLTPRRADCHASLRTGSQWHLIRQRFALPPSPQGEGRGLSRPRARATFAPGGKSSQKRRLDLRSKNPLARGETFLAGNFPTRPRRFFQFFPRSEGLCQHSFPRGAVARRWLVPR